jgi:hypothetical protein
LAPFSACPFVPGLVLPHLSRVLWGLSFCALHGSAYKEEEVYEFLKICIIIIICPITFCWVYIILKTAFVFEREKNKINFSLLILKVIKF